MATKRWIGGAQAVAQVTTVSYSTYTSGQTYRIICNNKVFAFVATASTAANVLAGIVALLNASTEKEVLEFTASSDGSVITLTGATAGVPFTVTATQTTGTSTVTTTTAATGPNHWDNAYNWSGAALPSAGDALIVEAGSYSILYGLVDANNYASLTIDSTFTGLIGLPAVAAAGYREYRARFLKLGDGSSTIVVNIGQGKGSKSGRINLDLNDATGTIRVYSTGQSQDNFEGPLVIKNTDSSSTFLMHSGVALLTADTSGSFSTVKLLPNGDQQGASVVSDTTVALGAITMNTGELECRGSATSVNASQGAKFKITGAATCPTVTVSNQAKIYWSSSAGITTLAGGQAGEIYFGGETTSKTITNASIGPGCIVSDPSSCVTWTNGIKLSACRLKDVQIDFGNDVFVKRV